MEANILIKILDDIDNQLSNNMYKEKRYAKNTLTGVEIKVTEITKYRLNVQQLTTLYDRKIQVVNSLHKLGIIKDDDYKEYMLSENPKFTPKLHINP